MYNVILINLSLINVFKGCGSQGELICDSRVENWRKNQYQKNEKKEAPEDGPLRSEICRADT
jgi:hypothetical protein